MVAVNNERTSTSVTGQSLKPVALLILSHSSFKRLKKTPQRPPSSPRKSQGMSSNPRQICDVVTWKRTSLPVPVGSMYCRTMEATMAQTKDCQRVEPGKNVDISSAKEQR